MMEEVIRQPMDWVTVGLVLVVILLLIRLSALSGRLKRLRTSYTRFMDNSGVDDLEQVIVELKERLSSQERNHAELVKAMSALNEKVDLKKGNIAMQRYNAFDEHNNNLSFSVAIVNDREDGIVMTGLHTRDETFVYAKPLKRGESPYQLTPEERKVITLATQRE